MKLYLACLLSLFFATFVSAIDKPTATLPDVSAGIVCAMSLCPTASLSKRDLACPAQCKDSCTIIVDKCCPGVQKAICANSNFTNAPATSVPTSSSAVVSSSSLLPTSSSAPVSSSSSSSSTQPTQSSANTTPSSAETTRIVWSSIVGITFVAFIINAF